MFTIDLRKGLGLPPKSRPIIVILATIPFMIPLLATLVTAACWQHNQMLIKMQQKIVKENQQKIRGLEKDIETYYQIESQSRSFREQLQNTDEMLQYRIQFTPILDKLIESFPESLLITNLELNRNELRKKGSGDKSEKQNITIQRKLQLTVGGLASTETDESVGKYVQALYESPDVMKWFTAIRIASRNNSMLNGRNYAFYEIECVMKDQN